MSVFALLLWIVILGVAVWLVNKTDIKPLFKTLAYVVCGVVAVGLVLEALGLLDALQSTRVPRVNR